MPTQNVNLSEQQAAFIHAAIERGHFCNASEVVRAGIRALEMQMETDRLKLKALRERLAPGLREADAGIYADYSLDAIRKKLNKKRKNA